MAKKKVKITRTYERSGLFSNYLLLWFLFAMASYALKKIVLYALSKSPTGATTGNGIMTLFEVHNSGAAFNLFDGQIGLLIAASIIAIVIITVSALIMNKKVSSSLMSAFALLSSGISVNLAERIIYGYVIDYIRLDFIPDFPMFNMSDILIVCGAIGLIISLLTRGKD